MDDLSDLIIEIFYGGVRREFRWWGDDFTEPPQPTPGFKFQVFTEFGVVPGHLSPVIEGVDVVIFGASQNSCEKNRVE